MREKFVTEMCHEIQRVKQLRTLNEVACKVGITLPALKKQMTRNRPTVEFTSYYEREVKPFLDNIVVMKET